MGAYLSEPVTEKISSDGSGERLKYGASSMQGWRVSQEDAHNCIVDYDADTSLFAVYDGHGGHEVALYSSQKLPDFIKDTEAYKKDDIENALIDAFLGFDGTIATRAVVAVLKELAGSKDENSDHDSEDEENVSNLCEEASMPIEQVIEKYQTGINPSLKKLQSDVPNSPYLRARRSENEAGSSKSTNEAGCSDQSGPGASGEKPRSHKCDTSTDANQVTSSNAASANVDKTEDKSDASCQNHIGDNAEVSSATTTKDETSPDSSNNVENNHKKEEVEVEEDSKEDKKNTEVNGEMPVTSKSDNVCSSTTILENGEVANSSPKGKGKGKAIKKISDSQKKLRARTLRIRNARHLYTKLLDLEESDSEDENDETFEGGELADEDSSEEVDNDEEEVDNEEDAGSSDDADDEDNSEEEDLEEGLEEEDDDEDDEFARNIREEPGSDSGCTAVVAVVRGQQVYVANAGDSRCIISREGQAVELSQDHKPEDVGELQRIRGAGGKVTQDGRVNGGLNLSRAIGDHAYKQNKQLSDRLQMITALPDVRTHTLDTSKDEFMVLACDGIWNFMSSQEVVEFVRPRLAENIKLSTICEEMFDHCLAPNTMGDGTGCDNMTAIIVKFNDVANDSSVANKRSASPTSPSLDPDNKKLKTDHN